MRGVDPEEPRITGDAEAETKTDVCVHALCGRRVEAMPGARKVGKDRNANAGRPSLERASL